MKLSIITPSYNQGRYIASCINSVKKQAADIEVEHIVLDNCSTDETRNILEEYKKNPGSVDLKIFIENDNGQTAAINKGFELATGDVVCWLNTDEWYLDGSLKKIVDFFKNNPLVDVVFGDCDYVDSSGRVTGRRREFCFSKNMLIYYGCYIPSCATFVKKRVIDEGNYLNPDYKVNMDGEWYVRLAALGYKFKHIHLLVSSFLWHESNISSNFIERRDYERALIQDKYGFLFGPSWFRRKTAKVLHYSWMAFRFFGRLLFKTWFSVISTGKYK